MPLEVLSTPYGRPALERLRAAIADAKDGDPLAPVGVVVPSNHVGVTARRALASGGLGPGTHVGVAAVTFLTAYRLAELLGAPSLAAAGRRPVSTPVIAAALRRALRDDPGIFAPVAEHPATETALVATFAELSDVSEDGLFALAGAGRRAHDVVGLYRRARDRLGGAWYHESDLTAAAIAALATAEGRALAAELGRVVVYLPQDLLQRQAALLAALAEACPTTVIAGLTGKTDADVGVRRSLARLGAHSPADPLPGPGPEVGPGRTRILSASDADDEVRAAVRQVVQAALDGTPLERIAVLYGTPQPYDRLVHEHLAAAGVPCNGASIRPLAASVVGRTLLDLLALPDHDFRRADMLGVLARAPGRATAPIATWERQSRQAGVVAGRAHWDRLLARLAREHDHRADLLQESYDRAMAERATDEDFDALDALDDATSDPAPGIAGDHPESEAEPAADATGDHPTTEADSASQSAGEAVPEQPPSGVRRERRLADSAHELRRLALAIVDAVDDAGSRPAPWSERVAWLRTLAADVVSGRPESRDGWPADEVRAADSIDAALDRLAALDAVDHPPTLEVFRRTLELELDADLGRVGRLGEGVLVGPLSFAVGLDLDLVVVLGMAEGTLPATVHDDSLLPDAERARAGDQLPLRRERVGREHRRLLAALAAADRQLLCLPRGDLRASSERVPSRWLLDVAAGLAGGPVAWGALRASGVPGLEVIPSFAHAVAHTSVPATDQEYRLRAGAARVHDPLVDRGAEVIRARRSPTFTRFDGNLAGVGVPSPVDEVVSSTRLESWATCPFAYFARRLLRVDPVEDPEHQLQMSAMDRGSLVHEVLERFVASVLARLPDARPGPGDDWTAEDHALIRRIAEDVCDEFEARGATGRPVFWRRDRPQILALVDRFLDDDAARRRVDGTRPLAAEHAFGLGDDDAVEIGLHDGRTLRFRGSADRIDEGPDGGLVVLDYKTGRADDYRRLGPDNPDDRGTRLQLAVYAQAARAAVGRPDAPVRSEYWFVSERGGFARHGYQVDDAVLARVTTTLGTMVEGIEQGAFPPHPDDQFRPWVVCPYCDPDGMGVAELRRQWERKREDPAVAAYAALAEGDLP
ncbi:MAG TPA: PD-(D/E)XK nuclease family protein [Acidimicrobiales bacterium]|nr:PD-(D/E)XK nuclease family protein [Acidimicrobiales bacterium]